MARVGAEAEMSTTVWRSRLGLTLLAVIVVVLASGIGLGLLVHERQADAAQRRVDDAVGLAVADLERVIGTAGARLAGASGVVGPDGSISVAQFEAFARPLSSSTAVAGVALNLVVADHERTEFEQWLGGPITEQSDSGMMVSAAVRPEYRPVAAVAPRSEENEQVLGFDHLSDPVRAQTLRLAKALDSTVVSDPVQLASGTDGFFIVQPMYPLDAGLETLEERSAAIVGFITVAYNAAELVDEIRTSPDFSVISVHLDGRPLLTDTQPELSGAEFSTITVLGHQWSVFLAGTVSAGWGWPLTIFAVAVLIAVLVAELIRRAWRYERELELWTAAVEREQQRSEKLRMLTAGLAETTTIEEVCELAVDQGRQVLGSTWAMINVVDRFGQLIASRESGTPGTARSRWPLVAQHQHLGEFSTNGLGDTNNLGQAERPDDALQTTVISLLAGAVQRTQHRQADHELAEALQVMLLPRLPERMGVDSVFGMYRPLSGSNVGGDWYDALPTSSGNAYVIGDVVGKGIHAAGAMGNLRMATRMVAENHLPERILAALDVVAEEIPEAFMTTAAVVIADLRGRQLRVSCAGHPPPLLLGRDGRAIWLDTVVGPPLGMANSMPRSGGTVPWEEDLRLIMYTDGLVEQRGGTIDEGLARLVETATRCADLALPKFCDTLVAEMVGPGQRDDVAVLAVDLPFR
jgi:CHASE1-domain containing sensor protein